VINQVVHQQMFTDCKIIGVNVNPDEYHRAKTITERGSPEHPISWSALKEFAQCPQRWKAGYNSPGSEAKRYGNLIDTRLLTPKQFLKRYAIRPTEYTNDDGETKPWNANSKVCKQWLEEHKSMDIVSHKEVILADQAIQRLLADEVIAAFIEESEKQVLVQGFWEDKRSDLKIPVQALIDLVPKGESQFAACVGDLKTTKNAGVMVWQRFSFQMGYYIQAAFNLDMIRAATQQDRNTFVFILQENYTPYQSAKRMLSQDFLTLGRAEVDRLISNYCACVKSNRWPGYDEHDESIQGSWSLVSPEPWMAQRAQFAPQFNFEPDSEEENEPTEEEMQEVVP